jgi:hypothetical protein
MKWLPRGLAAASLLLAGTSGFLASTVLAQGGEPIRTVTVDVATGPQGPAGPIGPQGETGPAGNSSGGGPCTGAPPGYSAGVLLINAPGGQVRVWTCLGPEP